MKRIPFTSQRIAAFTLIELMVVIAIIIVLGSFLVPVTSQLFENARETKCTNNLRQLGVVIQTEAMDHDGTYPRIENDPNNPIHSEDDGKVWTLRELVQARGVSLDILKCPSDLEAKLARPKDGKN